MKAGIVIPFRDSFKNGERYEELQILLERIEKICTEYNQDHVVCIVEQDDDQLFNRGSLINAGVDILRNSCDYFISHDVDNIPMGFSNDYRYREYTGNICGMINGEEYKDGDNHFGDIVFFKKEDYFAINGISNYYWGWGFEVSNTPQRLKNKGIKFKRGDAVIATMVHETSGRFNGNPNFVNNVLIYHLVEMFLLEGLNEIKYTLTGVEKSGENAFTHKIILPPPQYDVTRTLTVDEIIAMVGECNEEVYNEVVKTYTK